MENNIDKLKKLRDPFKPNQISQLPKPYKKDSQKGNCSVCGGYHGLPAMHLDYVGHAALTDRLLDVDPLWTWEPVAFDTHGLPALDNNGGLWIKLTICGVTRLGYGDAEGKTGGIAMKERIGDALRNAAMRFGAALDLWHKGDLHGDDEQEPATAEPQRQMERQPDTKPVKHPDNAFGGPDPDAEIIAQLNAAKDTAGLTKVMNSLSQGDKKLYTGHFNQCMSNLKKAA